MSTILHLGVVLLVYMAVGALTAALSRNLSVGGWPAVFGE